MIEPEQNDIGRAVIFNEKCGCRRGLRPRKGTIHNFNERWVYVVFPGSNVPTATARKDLEWQHTKGIPTKVSHGPRPAPRLAIRPNNRADG